MFAARPKCARQISTALNAAAVYRLRRLLCGRLTSGFWLVDVVHAPSRFSCAALSKSSNRSMYAFACSPLGKLGATPFTRAILHLPKSHQDFSRRLQRSHNIGSHSRVLLPSPNASRSEKAFAKVLARAFWLFHQRSSFHPT